MTLSTTDDPGHGDFIIGVVDGASLIDWRSPPNDNLWQGVSGTNNPCPAGFRLPTNAEWINERASWGNNDVTGAITSPLKLPAAGTRTSVYGTLINIGYAGWYGSSTYASPGFTNYLNISPSGASIFVNYRAMGYSVRCIQD